MPSSPPETNSTGAIPLPPRPERYVALDYGARRVGVAVSDDLGLYAHPRPAITGLDGGPLRNRIAGLVASEEAGAVIVGVPFSMSGSESAQTDEVRAFISTLRDELPVPVYEVDERLSSVQAAGMLKGRERKRSGQRDSAAAAIMLQSYLDSRRGDTAT